MIGERGRNAQRWSGDGVVKGEKMGEDTAAMPKAGLVIGGEKEQVWGNAAARLTAPASAACHRPDRQPSKLTPNFGSWAGRLHAVLGARLW